MIFILRVHATSAQIAMMLGDFYIKLAVDVERQILAGGGSLHADCEGERLADGSQQQNLWGASWSPYAEAVLDESMINLRPRENRSMQILDPAIRSQVKSVIDALLGAA